MNRRDAGAARGAERDLPDDLTLAHHCDRSPLDRDERAARNDEERLAADFALVQELTTDGDLDGSGEARDAPQVAGWNAGEELLTSEEVEKCFSHREGL